MLKIRIGTKEDITNIASLHTKNWRENYQEIFKKEFLMTEKVEIDRMKVWTSRLEKKDDKMLILVAEYMSQFAGFACSFIDYKVIDHFPNYPSDEILNRSTLSYIDNLHVDSRFRKKSIGTKLMLEAGRWMKTERPNEPVFLAVFEKNENSLRYYEKIGGKKTTEKSFVDVSFEGSGVPKALLICWKSVDTFIEILERKILSLEK